MRQEADLGEAGGDGPRAAGGGHGAGVAGGGLQAPDVEMGRRAWSCETRSDGWDEKIEFRVWRTPAVLFLTR